MEFSFSSWDSTENLKTTGMRELFLRFGDEDVGCESLRIFPKRPLVRHLTIKLQTGHCVNMSSVCMLKWISVLSTNRGVEKCGQDYWIGLLSIHLSHFICLQVCI